MKPVWTGLLKEHKAGGRESCLSDPPCLCPACRSWLDVFNNTSVSLWKPGPAVQRAGSGYLRGLPSTLSPYQSTEGGCISDVQGEEREERLRDCFACLNFGYISIVWRSALSTNPFLQLFSLLNKELLKRGNEKERPYSVEMQPADQEGLTSDLHPQCNGWKWPGVDSPSLISHDEVTWGQIKGRQRKRKRPMKGVLRENISSCADSSMVILLGASGFFL